MPDFIPVLGYIDDMLLLPLGILAVRKLIPGHIIAEHRARLTGGTTLKPSRAAAVVIMLLWLAGVILAAALLARTFL